MTSEPLRVLVLMPGPKFDLEWEFGTRLAGLSRFSSGYVVVTGQPAQKLAIGAYEIVATHFWPESALSLLRSRLAFVMECLRTVSRAKRRGRGVQLLVCYDPLLTGLIGWAVARMLGAKLVCEVNGDYSDRVNFLHVRLAAVRVVKSWAALRLVRFVLSRAAGIRLLHPSQLEKIGYRRRPGQVVEQIPDFVDTSVFVQLGEEKTILVVGFPFFVKGIDTAIAAFRQVAAAHPDWVLKIMGHYPDGEELQKAIGDCPRIVHQPPVTHRHMPAHIGRCGIVLQPSRTEAMGRVLVEAMAAGKPRVASRVGGIPTVVADGEDGILVDPEDVDGFARALAALMSSAELRQRLGAAGARRAASELSTDEYFRKTERFYRRVIDAQADGR
jgi:glycosyltransferase involved in cell wall biosynthesis